MSADKVLTFKFPVFKNGNKPIVYLLDIKVNKEIFNKIDKKIKHSGSIDEKQVIIVREIISNILKRWEETEESYKQREKDETSEPYTLEDFCDFLNNYYTKYKVLRKLTKERGITKIKITKWIEDVDIWKADDSLSDEDEIVTLEDIIEEIDDRTKAPEIPDEVVNLGENIVTTKESNISPTLKVPDSTEEIIEAEVVIDGCFDGDVKENAFDAEEQEQVKDDSNVDDMADLLGEDL